MGINTTYYQNQPVLNRCLPRHPLNFAAKFDCADQLRCASNLLHLVVRLRFAWVVATGLRSIFRDSTALPHIYIK